MSTIPVIIGPTASGKSNLALALAMCTDSDIISLDSMQIYQGLDIGTAKVTPAERKAVKHHLIDIIPPTKNYSIADFLSDYNKLITQLQKSKRKYLLVGGSLQYLSAIWYNDSYTEISGVNPDYREKLQKEYLQYAANHPDNKQNPVYLQLCALDPERAAVLHPNDCKRIVRALEIIAATANPASAYRFEHKSNQSHLYTLFAYDRPREELYRRINERVLMMVKAGLLQEARKVYEHRNEYSQSCLQAIAYKEFFPYFEGKMELDAAISSLQLNSRHYAKRQLSIMRKLPINYLPVNAEISTIITNIKNKCSLY